MRGAVVHRFGPFELDPASRQLYCDQKPVRLSSPQSAILTLLVSNAGVTVTREDLINAGWGGAAINDNSLNQAMVRLRQLLSGGQQGVTYIETLPQEGYRFTAAVQKAERSRRNTVLDTELAPYRAFVQGQTELDTLDRAAIGRARKAFEQAILEAPDYAPAHMGLAMACGLAFEAMRPDTRPDRSTLELGIRHAERACTLAPMSGEAWGTLSFILSQHGDVTQAAAAARKAMDLEPGDWRHALRAAYVNWGEERLRASRQVQKLNPGMALPHWFQATVFIARGALDIARDELRAGCAAQDVQAKGSTFAAVGLHLLHALVLAAHDRLDDAVAELTRELDWADSGQLHARECAANTWYALGAIRLRQKQRSEAEAAFTRALTISPGDVSASAALHGVVPSSASRMESATGQAIVLARGNRHSDAARVYREAVTNAPPGFAGWMLAVEPMLNPLARREVWADVLALIRTRAA